MTISATLFSQLPEMEALSAAAVLENGWHRSGAALSPASGSRRMESSPVLLGGNWSGGHNPVGMGCLVDLSGSARPRDRRDHSVRSFVEAAASRRGFDIEWSGSGPDERGTDRCSGRTIVRVNPAFYRPAEVDTLVGNPKKAQEILGWRRKVGFEELVTLMAEADDKRARDHSETGV
jgi:hypothetical protein